MESNFKVNRKTIECYWPHHMEDANAMYLIHNNGYYLTKEELQEFVLKLNNAIECYDSFGIGEFNSQIKKEREDQIQQAYNQYHETNNNTKLTRKNMTGSVYFITYDNKYYKIGKAKQLKDRLKVFSVEMPGNIEVFHVINSEDMWLTEKLFHDYYADKRVNGEWFNLSVEDLNYIKNGKYPKNIMNSIKGVV